MTLHTPKTIGEILTKHTVQIEDTHVLAKTFVVEFTDKQFTVSRRIIKQVFSRLFNIHNPFDFFGLPYTSSGSYAGLWNTNQPFYAELSIGTQTKATFSFDGLAIDKHTNVYAIFTNLRNDEHTLVFRINKREK